MIIQNLKLVNFRSYKAKSFDFVSGVNLITGPNGAGKTNILEAVYLLSTGKSFRTKLDVEMILNPNANFAKVTGSVSNGKDRETLDMAVTKGIANPNLCRKTFKVNGTPKRIYDCQGFLPCVLFSPQDLELFTGSPSLRRRFLDDLLCSIDRKYKKEHNIYTKALRQRNKVLEKIAKFGLGHQELPFWTDQILNSGRYLQETRTKVIDTLNPLIQKIYGNISSNNVGTHIEYKINEISPARLEKHKEHEIQAKTTLVGPHRDDFELLIDDFNIAFYGSRGQQRTGVLSIKISELDIVGKESNQSPILLLDDVFSELDDAHKNSLKSIVRNQQTVITSTHQDIVADNTIQL